MGMDNVCDILDYVKKHKLTFRPDVLLQLIAKRDQLMPNMVHQKAKKYIIDTSECIHCIRRQDYAIQHNIQDPRAWLCKKHASLYDWEVLSKHCARIYIEDIPFWLFGEFVATPMQHDLDGLYVIWFAKLDTDRSENSKYAIFTINRRYFPNIDTRGMDITKFVYEQDIIKLGNSWVLVMDDEKPLLEEVR